jgi:hypothetical protein
MLVLVPDPAAFAGDGYPALVTPAADGIRRAPERFAVQVPEDRDAVAG